jgi:hypothetical protein
MRDVKGLAAGSLSTGTNLQDPKYLGYLYSEYLLNDIFSAENGNVYKDDLVRIWKEVLMTY